MYSFQPSEEQKMLVDALSRYALTDLRAKAHDADEEFQLPPALIEKGWELGYLQASIPEDLGGFGEHSVVTGALAAEELVYGDLAGALGVLLPASFAVPILLAGSPEQKERFLPPLCEAEWQPYSTAWIEPQFDYDPYELKTTAVEDGDVYVLTGEKAYVPFADQAEWLLVYARLGDETQAFIVSAKAEGVKLGERQKLMGIRALPVFKLTLNGVRVPKADRLGGPDGHAYSPLIDSARVAMAASAVGLARAAFDYAREYAKDRDVFGVKVAQKQAIAFMLAEMATEIESIRLLVWEAAWKMDTAKEDASQAAYLAFSGAADMVMMVTDRAVQILGGHGYIREHPVELWMRNGRGIATFTGLMMI
jgi:acyl-CoA dehydrogenase